ncbi:tetraspanin-8-like [Plectropomus leopardus]|uniref:tetraspanin-8-like n=1 Tax=Plectropomus leopardus TaxID=160734 RepID=UPI001C4DB258|nr:tetraspanin-8-like [Plectropomus leopardus]
MGKANVCLKRSYITVTSLILIVCALLLAVTLFSHGYIHGNEKLDVPLTNLSGTYIFSIITLTATIFGLYGACKEKKWALIVFAVIMILSSLAIVANIIMDLAMRPKMLKTVKMQFRNMLSPRNATDGFADTFKDIEMKFQCCGVDQGYHDWGYNISESCVCTDETTNPCVEAPRNSSLYEHRVNDQPIMIYEEACFPYMIADLLKILDIVRAVNVLVALVWISSVVLCITILCQLGRKKDSPAVVYSQEAKAGNYTILLDPSEKA